MNETAIAEGSIGGAIVAAIAAIVVLLRHYSPQIGAWMGRADRTTDRYVARLEAEVEGLSRRLSELDDVVTALRSDYTIAIIRSQTWALRTLPLAREVDPDWPDPPEPHIPPR